MNLNQNFKQTIMSNIFSGVITALITPFLQDKLDLATFEKILDYQSSNGIKSVVIAGSTGEGSSLSTDERAELLNVGLKNKKLQIILGCNAFTTLDSLKLATSAEKLGAHGLMITPPPYTKPTQNGIFEHIKSVHDATRIPIMIYSVPSRTCVDFTDQTILKLSELERIVAFKDAGNDLQRPLRLSADIADKINILAGDDYLALAFNAHGAKGAVSVASNLLPTLMIQIQDLWHQGKIQQSIELQTKTFAIYKALFKETNPIGIKYAMHLAGFGSAKLRLPLTELQTENKLILDDIMTKQVLKNI